MRIATVVFTILFAACAGSMANIKGGACEAGCDQAKDKCVSECAADESGVKDAACELACEETRKKCVSDCKE